MTREPLGMDEPAPVDVAIHRSMRRGDCCERALILDAIGIKYGVTRTGAEYAIMVASEDESRARAELDAHARENRGWTAQTRPLHGHANGWGGVLGYCALLVVMAVLQHRHADGYDWLAVGRMNAGLVCQGEWWRTVTALSLHADFAHLAANLVFGILFGLFAGQLFGSGFAWLTILIAGAMGNAMNAWVQPASHNSVGASTALFAALGLLSCHAWRQRRHTEHGWTRRLAPLIGGAVLLAFTGSGGERTDVIAHLTGFISGVLVGLVCGILPDSARFKDRTQLIFGATAIMVVVIAWRLSLSGSTQ